VPYNQILPSLGLLLFSLLIAQGCTADNRSVVTPVATFHSSVGSQTAVSSDLNALVAEPASTLMTVTPAAPNRVSPTPTYSSRPTISSTATVTSERDLRSLGLLVFDQRSRTMGRLSFDGTRFQPLTQVPKLDAAGLEFGLFSEQTGYYVSPDGQWLSTVIGYDQLVLIDTLADERHAVARIGAGAWLNWSPDGRALAYREGDHSVCIYRLAGPTTNCLDEFDGRIVAAAWSLDGARLALTVVAQSELAAAGMLDGAVRLVDLSTGEAEFVTNQQAPLGGMPANYLLVWTARGLIANHVPGSAPALLIQPDSEAPLAAHAVAASPSGNYVVYEDGLVERLSDGAVLAGLVVCSDPQDQTLNVAWAHDESRFAYTVRCQLDAIYQVGIVHLDPEGVNRLAPIPGNLRLIGWSHDNRGLFFRRDPDGTHRNEYGIERLGTDPGGALETVADSVFLLDILPLPPTELTD
jgi:hypothetical protein